MLQEKDQQLEALTEQLEEQKSQRNRHQGREKEVSSQLQGIERQLPKLEAGLQQLDRLSSSYDSVRKQFPDEDIHGLTRRLEQKQQQLRETRGKLSSDATLKQGKQQELYKLQTDYQAFCSLFPNQQPQGLEGALWQEKNELDHQIQREEERIGKLQVLVSDLKQFQEQFPGADPEAWLAKAQQAYPQRLIDQSRRRSAIEDVERLLEDLETDPVSPGGYRSPMLAVTERQWHRTSIPVPGDH